MTIHADSKLSLDIIQYLGEVVAEVSADGMIHDVRMRNTDKYPGEEERYRGNKLSDIHPAEVADKFTALIKKALRTGESQYLEFQTSYKKQPVIYSVRILPQHADEHLAYFIIDDITSKDRLELMENKWKMALDASGDGMWDYNLQANTIYFSDRWHEIFGYSKDEISGSVEKWTSKVDLQDVEESARLFEGCVKGETNTYSSEFKMKCKDGSYKWVLSRGVVISRTPDGKPLRMIGTHTDITARKSAEQSRNDFEEQLQSQKDFYEQILNWLPGDIAVLDKDYRFMYLNERSVKDPEVRKWMIGKTDFDYCRERNRPLDIAQGRKQRYDEVRNTGRQQEWEERFTTAEGDTNYKLRRLQPVMDEQGDLRLMVGYGVDITEKVRTEEALRTSNEMFTSAFDSSGIGMALVSPFGKWLNVNNSVCEITGYSKEELLQKTFQEITHPDDLELDLGLLKQMLNKEIEVYNLEKRYISKSKKIVWVLLTVSMVWNADNTPKFVIAQIVDITKRKELTDEINRKNKELEATKVSLINKIQQLEELNYIIAHNLRGPARNINMLASALSAKHGGTHDEESLVIAEAFTDQEAISLMVEGAKALTENLDTLMEVAKISLNKKIQYDDCNVEQMVQNITSQLSGVMYEKHARITTKLAIKDISYPSVYLESILYNFISNAIKYSRKDVAPEIIVSTTKMQGRVVLSVKDNGLGIDLDRYGDRLFKLNQVFHHGFDSKGVGLFLTKSQIEALGGSVEVKSMVNEGTEFIVTL
ncbi:PAS domain S-box protein [Polluticoccus soli]|uniref:PAS domain S-box protein n=1 Tax=Polluticoccus soli TaxID=3034150 RepID=UPI0023E0A1EA|nr:PAS domain S-box protein [Flavipsychrobacter sp. JY13-12]